jgi:hypothetical protein
MKKTMDVEKLSNNKIKIRGKTLRPQSTGLTQCHQVKMPKIGKP